MPFKTITLHMKSGFAILLTLLLCSCHSNNNSKRIGLGKSNDTSVVNGSNKDLINIQNINLNEIKDTLQLDEVELLGTMTKSNKTILLLYGEKTDLTYREQGLFVYPIDPIPHSDSIISVRFSLPGNEYDMFDSVVFQARVFYGNCTEKFPYSIVWIQKEKQKNQSWINSIFILTPDNPVRVTFRLSDDGELLREIIEKMNKGECKEIPGMDIYLEP